jgi:AraC-like DNA-binding protein
MGGSRPATVLARRIAVERVVAAMRERPEATFSLRAMADVALLSPYHFNRVFRSVTGIPPQAFLTCVRMQAAKRLLLTTALRVTDVCFSVGYRSVGTFTSRFTELVGLPPRRFRELSQDDDSLLRAVLRSLTAGAHVSDGPPRRAEVFGEVSDPHFPGGPIFVGLLQPRTPAGRPAGCAFLTSPGAFRIRDVADGRYRIMAAAFGWSGDIREYLLPDHSRLRVGASRPVVVRDGRVIGNPHVRLRPMEAIDPPILIALHATSGRRPEPSGDRRVRRIDGTSRKLEEVLG